MSEIPSTSLPNKKRNAEDGKGSGDPSKQPALSSQGGGPSRHSNPNLSGPTEKTKREIEATKLVYQSFLEAYEGKNTNLLGGDSPKKSKGLIEAALAHHYVLILSTKDQSELLRACEDDGVLEPI